jgi:hypothetical protein
VPNQNSPQTGGNHWWAVTLNRNQTYRVEERLERTAAGVYTFHARIYNSANQLLFDDDDFVCVVGHGSHTLASSFGSGLQLPDETCLRHRTIYNQGVGSTRGSDDPNANSIFYAGFAISLTDWVGPYVPGEAG